MKKLENFLKKKFIKECRKNNLDVFVWNAKETNAIKFDIDYFIL